MNDIFAFSNNSSNSFTFVKMLVPAFMAILFLQSGMDKLFNYTSTLAYFTDHFKNSPLSKTVKILTPVITFLEIIAGILCAIGTVSIILMDNSKLAFGGLMVAAVAFLSLFLGQRVVKDYAGAGSITLYFILNIIGLLLLA
jgi:uncharacterized membrane protein YphA (DoxX/SURF4 family)